MKSKEYSKNKNRGDIIVISLIDESNTTFFKGKARLRDKKGIQQLLEEAETKGLSLSKEIGWFK